MFSFPLLLRCLRSLAIPVVSLGVIMGSQAQYVQQLQKEWFLPSERERLVNIRMAEFYGHLGYSNLASGWLWLEFVQFYGSVVTKNIPFEQRPSYQFGSQYLWQITQLDPRFLLPYSFVVNTVAWKQGDPEQARQILGAGLHSLSPLSTPTAYSLWLSAGLIDVLFLADPNRVVFDFDHAAEWVNKVQDPAVIAALGLGKESVAALRDQGRSLATRVRDDPNYAKYLGWSQIFLSADDPQIQADALTELRALGANARLLPNGRYQLVPPPPSAGSRRLPG